MINDVHWFSPTEHARIQIAQQNPDAFSDDIYRNYPIRDVHGYPVIPTTWTPIWRRLGSTFAEILGHVTRRLHPTWDYNRRPPLGSGTRPEPFELVVYPSAPSGGGGGGYHSTTRPRTRMR
jgi:hypothetical protein